MQRDLPTGTVTFLFSDVEGSTRLLHALGAEAYGEALAEHRRVLRDAFAAHGGVEVDTQGDAFFFVFPRAPEAAAAAYAAQEALAAGPIQVWIGLHCLEAYDGTGRRSMHEWSDRRRTASTAVRAAAARPPHAEAESSASASRR